MKYVRFENGHGFVEITNAADEDTPDVRFDAQGDDDQGDRQTITLWLPATEARELARYINETADAAEATHQQMKAGDS